MSTESERTRPNVVEYIGYCYGRVLPESMHDWVRNDLAGKGATVRMMIRVFIPAFVILIPFVFFSHALNKVWRRHMLRKHGMDPNLVDALSRQKNAHVHEAYIERYGPRSGPSSSHDV